MQYACTDDNDTFLLKTLHSFTSILFQTAPSQGKSVSDGACFSCSFESNSECGQVTDTDHPTTWLIREGPSPIENTGPKAVSDKGFYMYLNTKPPVKAGDFAQ